MSGFVVKFRASGGLMVSDYECPTHGTFEVTVERPALDFYPCPTCAAPAERRITGTIGRVRLDEVTRGKSDPPPSPIALDTRALADGMKPSAFKKQRKKMWNDLDRAKWKAKLG